MVFNLSPLYRLLKKNLQGMQSLLKMHIFSSPHFSLPSTLTDTFHALSDTPHRGTVGPGRIRLLLLLRSFLCHSSAAWHTPTPTKSACLPCPHPSLSLVLLTTRLKEHRCLNRAKTIMLLPRPRGPAWHMPLGKHQRKRKLIKIVS
uniref:Uncharacterized protein n=1 Tax=Pipistrellus kuhlii TaxID=59472 RepID=A0A7J7ZJ35_PIPKU|nr:hypothetical protein mPipKuh1_009410 [Pipistrellus kuhlii]